MDAYIWLLIGVAIGSIITCMWFLFFKRATGILKIDQSNPEKDLYSLEIEDDLDILPKKKKIVFKVKNITNLSQN